jgi:hypothetical protein
VPLSKYVVVKFGDLHRGESMNVAVLAWDHEGGPRTPVLQAVLKDWTRVHRAFSSVLPDHRATLQSNVLNRLNEINTFEDYQTALARMNPYTPFEFTDERPSLTTAQECLTEVAAYFLQEPAPV